MWYNNIAKNIRLRQTISRHEIYPYALCLYLTLLLTAKKSCKRSNKCTTTAV